METEVVNILEKNYDVYIGRPNKKIQKNILGSDGIFGNPFKIGEENLTREESLNKFKEYFYKKIEEDETFKKEVEKLRGKTLGCWCKPLACHGDIYKEYFESINMPK